MSIFIYFFFFILPNGGGLGGGGGDNIDRTRYFRISKHGMCISGILKMKVEV